MDAVVPRLESVNGGLARALTRGRLVALGAAAALAVCVPAAFAAARGGALGGAPRTQPDLAAMALSTTDLPRGAVVKSQGYEGGNAFPLFYSREFASGASIGSSRVLGLLSTVGLANDYGQATLVVAGFAAELKTKQGRMNLVRRVLPDLQKYPRSAIGITYGGSRSFGVGDDSLEAELTVTLHRVRVPLSLAVVRVDRVVSALEIAGSPNKSVARRDVANLSGKVAVHIKTGLLPVNYAPPTISGTAQLGQTLTAATGSWTNWTSAQTVYVIQWQRCDTLGAGCTAIPGATAASYAVTTADVGRTLRVSIAASNPTGTSQAVVSAQTTVIS